MLTRQRFLCDRDPLRQIRLAPLTERRAHPDHRTLARSLISNIQRRLDELVDGGEVVC